MFVSDNTVKSVKNYFSARLEGQFTAREIKIMFQLCAQQRLQLSSADLLLADNLRMSESDLLYFRSVVKRLQTNEPFQYILGEVEFYGLLLNTDKRALIPRPETEELVDWIVSKAPNATTIVDVCTGSGCIALALKSKCPAAKVVGVDVSIDALNLAKENAKKTQLEVGFLQLDVLQQALPMDSKSIDVMVSNPPYVLENEKLQMANHVLDFEPALALFVPNNDPLLFYKKIVHEATQKLKTGGFLFFEINEQYGNDVATLLNQSGFHSVEIKQDLQGKDRMVAGCLA
ncbi:MAG TPA: peptide chain release factor N(5)-glutamine methyltransferase [Taishania sp.]|nr:peptide chain release factor N(5)-glutamine methyltransferase [Taishania sp.]